jgi:hypothetical protein
VLHNRPKGVTDEEKAFTGAGRVLRQQEAAGGRSTLVTGHEVEMFSARGTVVCVALWSSSQHQVCWLPDVGTAPAQQGTAVGSPFESQHIQCQGVQHCANAVR